MNLSTIKSVVTVGAGRGFLILKKFSPEILMTLGVVGVVGSTVLACKATLKVDDILEESSEAAEKIKRVNEESPEKYSDAAAKKDLLVLKTQTAVEFVKLYGPSVTLGVASIACMLSAHGIMRKRNLALIGAFKAVSQSFSDYRKRVVEEYGPDQDRMFKNGITKIEQTIMKYTDDNGVEHESETKTIEVLDPNNISQYARFFDECSTQWSKTPEYNLMYVKAQQNYANDLLKSRGHVFLNEVYDMLGVPRSQAGAVTGWVKGFGDDFIDFGVFNGASDPVRYFVNGTERSILLDFNVAGVIYDMI